ncbi:hypothetical protein Ancab_031508 [Ancistrocladus abbreviatus]
MMESSGGSAIGARFPVVLFDGEREIDLGNVFVEPSMNFKSFQSLISQKIGISPHQITIWFEKKISNNSNHSAASSFKNCDYRKIPVTNKFNFVSIISGHGNCFFLVVLKRNRRNRRRRPKQSMEDDDAYSIHSEITSPDCFMLLRRSPNPQGLPYNVGFSEAMAVTRENWYSGTEYFDYANRMKILERERERYLMSLNLNSNVYSDFNVYGGRNENFYGGGERISDDGASSSGGERERTTVCDVCMNYSKTMEEDETVPFHWCKFDAVTVGFRSPAGPIARPSKS